MKKNRWIAYVASRYVSRGRRNFSSLVFSVLGIASGVLALIIIIAVMNGFQLGFIESILEISSGHVRLEGFVSEKTGTELNAKLGSLPDVVSVLPFNELNVLLRGRQSNVRGALVRGVPVDALTLDPGLAGKLDIEEGFFDLYDPFAIVLGAELARYLSVGPGDQINLLSISGGIGEDSSRLFTVMGIFRSGFYEYDLNWAFINIDTAMELSGAATPALEVKLKNRWQDQKAIAEIEKILASLDVFLLPEMGSLRSWRDYNRAFFGALRTEKLMMVFLVGLIFIVVALNIFQAQRRIVLERREEIGLLRALGASDTAVRLVFVWDGFIIGLAGASLGLAPGLLIAFNISAVFSFLESTVNMFIHLLNFISGFFGGEAGPAEFAVFSPRIFYIKEIPSRVIPHEVLLIVLFGFFSALLAAWFASGKVSGTKPAEVLRYE